MKKIIRWIHFILLTIAILNTLFKSISSYSFTYNLEYSIEILVIISGLVLFFYYLTPFDKISYYFTIYAIIGFITLLGVIFRGMFWGIIMIVVLYPIIPDEIKYERDNIIIYSPFGGLMSMCCSYQVKEKKCYFFEKSYDIFELNGAVDFESMKISSTDSTIELTYFIQYEEGVRKTEILKN